MIHAIDAYTVLWREMLVLKRTFWKFITSVLVGPLLYLVAFGWGLGRSIRMDGSSYMDFVVPGIIVLTAMTTSFNGIGVYINISKLYNKTLEEYQISPISAFSYTLGKVLAGCVRGLIAAVLILALGYIFGTRISLGFFFFLIIFLTCFLFAALGVIVGLMAKSHEDMANFSSFVILPMAFLSGTFFSLDKLPQALAFLIELLPLTHSTYSLRAFAFGGQPSWVSLSVLAAYTVILFAAGIIVVKKVR